MEKPRPKVIVFYRPRTTNEIRTEILGKNQWLWEMWRPIPLVVVDYETKEILLEQYPAGRDFELYMKARGWAEDGKI